LKKIKLTQGIGHSHFNRFFKFRIPVLLLSSVFFSFLISLLITILLITQKAHATQIEVVGWDSEAVGSVIAPILGKIGFLFILFMAAKYACKAIHIDFPACILPKKIIKNEKGQDMARVNRDSFASFIFYCVYWIFRSLYLVFIKWTFQAIQLPIMFLLGRSQENHRPEGFMGSISRLLLLNPFNKGLLLNGNRDRISAENSFSHLVVLAPTSGGKSSRYIIPNIFTLDNCSMLVTDLSGELYKKTSGHMREKGFDIKIINPTDLNLSNRYNPLSSVKTHKDILDTATILITSADPNPKDPFWNNGAKKMLELVITSLVEQRKKLKNSGVQDYNKYCNLANLRNLLNNFGSKGKLIETFIRKYGVTENGFNKTLKEWQGFTSGNEKTTQGFLSTALTALAIVGNDDIAKLTANNEIDFNQIRHQKTIVYLQIPQQSLDTYGFFLNLFYSRFFSSCFHSNDTSTLPVYCLLDEAGHTRIPNLATIITTIRKYRVSISLILQSITQLETAYGESQAKTIMDGGVTSKIFYAGLDLETCQRLEKILGTVEREKEEVTTDNEGVRTTRKRVVRESLMDMQYIMRMKDRSAIYLFKNKKPTFLWLKPYFTHFLFKKYSEKSPYVPYYTRSNDKVEYIDFGF